MRAKLIIAALLWLALPSLGPAEPARPRYTTLIVEYTGESIGGSALPVVITTSQEEAEWYKQHFSEDMAFLLAYVQVVPQSVLNEFTGLPLLKRALNRAKPVENEPKTAQNARFTAGVGHDYVQIILEKQPSTKLLKGLERIAVKYPSLKAGVHQLEYKLR
jgi:hypothetical protein